jgi:hypothetical protein
LVKDVLVVRGCVDISRIEADSLVPHILWLKLGPAGSTFLFCLMLIYPGSHVVALPGL